MNISHSLDDIKESHDRNEVGRVLGELVDYTLSHFAFEESLMDDAGYSAAAIHKRTHDAFREKIQDYHNQHKSGEDVSDKLFQLLNVWLMNHIAEDDASYVPTVKKNIIGINSPEKMGWLKTKVHQYFN